LPKLKHSKLPRKQELPQKKLPLRSFSLIRKPKQKKQQKALLAYKKAKAQGLNPKVPTFLKPKKLVPRAIKPNPKKEAKKDAVEKKADALIK